MASSKKRANEDENSVVKNKGFRRVVRQINNSLGEANLSLYGTDRNPDIDNLNSQFTKIMNTGLQKITSKDDGDVTSFLSKIVSQDRKVAALDDLFDMQYGAANNDISAMASFIQEAYRNRIAEQADLHQVSSQLIELSEAILVTRDAIISADVVEGRMSRTLSFDNLDKDDENNYIPMVEHIEKKFKLLEKIKNFIVPKTLEYGEYYVYTIPYSKIFNDFEKIKQSGYRGHSYHESSKTLLEFVSESAQSSPLDKTNEAQSNGKTKFIDRVYMEYEALCKEEYDLQKDKNPMGSYTKPDKIEFGKDVERLLRNVSTDNTGIPLPILEEGSDSINEMYNKYVTESKPAKKENLFEVNLRRKNKNDSGVIISSNQGEKKKKDNFNDIGDCYIKLIEPTRVIPIKIMNNVIGYYYVQAEDITPVHGMISSTIHNNGFDDFSKEHTVIDSIVDQIINSFDKKFLKDNLKFKKIIADSLTYYNINEKRIKFQFIPVEYMQVFKIDEDENENGQSMIKKSLFYAKLYLMLLMFKIMSILINSNDVKVNYVKQSGIDKNIANKIQEIIRVKQSRQINVMDLFNYSTLINKVGSGNEMYVPVGRSGERGVETEILSGQDVQLNSDLLEMLKNSYILGTGVPATIINYLNEVEFAKVAEQNNTKFNGRVVNYQLDFNPSITEWYKKILKYSTNLPEEVISNFSFVLQPPKTVSSSAKQEMISSFQSNVDFIVQLLFKSPDEEADVVREFKILLAEEQLPSINMKNINKLLEQAKINAEKEKLKPSPDNGDDGDDMGLDGL